MISDYDAVIVGGGPGGAVCAAALAGGGRRVLLLEQAAGPREHVGESLSPSAWHAAMQLGVSAELRDAGFAPKFGATFDWGDDQRPWTVGYPAIGEAPSAYQVRRAEFDAILLKAASAAGAQVRLGWRADQVIHSDGQPAGVLAIAPDGERVRLTAPWVVDASGAPGLLGASLGRDAGPADLDNTAIWGYWRREGESPRGACANSLLVGRKESCFWYYPLDNRAGLASVGVVVAGGAGGRPQGDLEEFYRTQVSSCPELLNVLTGAVLDGPVTVGDARAYASKRMAGPGWFLVGDAACFVDALLTPGVQLAVTHGTLAAQCLQTILDAPAAQDAVFDLYDQVVRREYETFIRLSRNMYGAARVAAQPPEASGGPPARGPLAEPNGQFAFLSLISGLSKTDLAMRLGGYMGLRKAAAERGGAPVVLGEKEGFAFLSWLFHTEVLAAERAARITGELSDDCVLRPAPGAVIADEAFVPADGARALAHRTAARNRLGDRFEATPELVTLFAVLGTGCPYAKALSRFGEALALPDGECQSRFRDWIELLADHALVEWEPAGEGIECAA